MGANKKFSWWRSASLIVVAVLALSSAVALGNGNNGPVVHASAGPNGTIDPSGVTPVVPGESQTFRMSPATGHHVADVLVDGISVGDVKSYTFAELYENAEIFVRFAPDTHNIYVSTRGLGWISPHRRVEAPVGTNRTFTMFPLPGAVVTDVQVDGVSAGAITSYTFRNIRRHHTIRVIFGLAPNMITASAVGNGTISPAGRIVMPPSGGSQRFMMMPAEHHHVGDVLLDGVSVGAVPSYVFMDTVGQHTIQAMFEVDEYSIAASAEGNGSITPSGVATARYGRDMTFAMAAAEEGYHLADVQVDGVSVGPVRIYTFEEVRAPHTISARFAIDGIRRITVEDGPGGTIDPAGSDGVLLVMNGNNKTFRIVPERHYTIADVQVDGVSVGPVATYMFTNVTADHTITATFAIETVTITVSAGTDGCISPEGEVHVPYGGSHVFSMIADEGYVIGDVLIDGRSVGARDEWTFNSITRSHTIRATFTEMRSRNDGEIETHRSM